MRRESADVLGSGLLLAALVTATVAALAPPQGASAAPAPAAHEAVMVSSSSVDRGRTLFYAKGCIGCHKKAGERAGASVGPDLTGIVDRAGQRKPGMSADAYVRESIKTPSAFIVPGFGSATFGMPDLGLSDDEIDALTGLLLSTP